MEDTKNTEIKIKEDDNSYENKDVAVSSPIKWEKVSEI